MKCNECQNYSACPLPWKGQIVDAGSCGQFKKGKPLVDVCHYCDKPNPEEVDGPIHAHMQWELHVKEPDEHLFRVICKDCYEKVLVAFNGLYTKTVTKFYEIVLREQVEMKIKVLKELLKKNVCGICPAEFGKRDCESCDVYKAMKL